MRRHTDRFSAFQVGAVVIGVTTVLLYFAFTKANPFANPYKINAVFTSALSNGIKANSPVRIAGVAVGKVKDVHRGPGSTVVVSMQIDDRGQPIHTDATIKARPRLFLEGNYFLDLRPGTPSAPTLGRGATIPVTQTAVPVQFDQTLDTYDSDTRHSFQAFLGGLSSALNDGGAQALRSNLKAAPQALAQSSTALEATRGTQDGDLAAFVADQARLNTTLDAHRVQLGSLLTGFRGTMEALASEQAPLRATLPALRTLVARAPGASAAVDEALPPLRELAVALRPGLKIAPPILDRAQPFVTALASLAQPQRLGSLVRQLRPATQSIRDLEGSLPSLFALVKPVSECVTTRIVPVLQAKVPDGALSNDRTVWQEFFSLGTGLLSSQQNFGGDGYSTRYSFGIDPNGFATRLPGPGNLIQLTDSAQVGSRPAFHNKQPPFAPEASCLDQPLTTLAAETAPPPSGRSIPLHVDPRDLPTQAQLRVEARKAQARLRAQLKELKK